MSRGIGRARFHCQRQSRKNVATVILQLRVPIPVSREWARKRAALFLCSEINSMLARPLAIGEVSVRNRVFLAPMSGITDVAFRERAYNHGAGLVVSEMVASGELARGRGDTSRRIRHGGAAPHMVQLAGRDAAHMAEAGRIARAEGAEIIDINMGCPAKKVTGGYCGSALMRDLDQALRLVEAVIEAVDCPVTVKMRLGWDDASRNAPELAARAEQAGVAMVTVHGRTRCQFYEGRADWDAVRAVREAIRIPLVVNGDIGSLVEAQAALAASGADAVMVGRAHYGAPWMAGSIAAEAAGQTGVHFAPDDLTDYVVSHYEDMLSLYGIDIGVRQARKHLGWYLDCHAEHCDPGIRASILRSFDPTEVVNGLRAAFCNVEPEQAVAA